MDGTNGVPTQAIMGVMIAVMADGGLQIQPAGGAAFQRRPNPIEIRGMVEMAVTALRDGPTLQHISGLVQALGTGTPGLYDDIARDIIGRG